jgi:hypothetical protein
MTTEVCAVKFDIHETFAQLLVTYSDGYHHVTRMPVPVSPESMAVMLESVAQLIKSNKHLNGEST